MSLLGAKYANVPPERRSAAELRSHLIFIGRASPSGFGHFSPQNLIHSFES